MILKVETGDFKSQPILLCLSDTPVEVDISGNEYQETGCQTQNRACCRRCPEIFHRNQVLDLRTSGNAGHGDAKRPECDHSRKQCSRDIGRPVDGIAYRIDDKYDNK